MFTADQMRAKQPVAIDVRGVCKRFQGRAAIEDFALTVRRGAICGIAGPNGGGKSTTLRLLAGLLVPDAGAGVILGCDLLRAGHLIRQRVGYLAQQCTLYSTLTVCENLRFRASIFGLSRPARTAEEQMRAFGLSEFSSVPVGRLSGGWSRQVQLAATLIHQPQLLLLDEPTAGLDLAARYTLWRTLTSLATGGTAIVVCTHDLGEAARCSELLFLSDARVQARGSPKDILSKIDAAALLVSTPQALHLSELVVGPLVIAADTALSSLRLLVALEHLETVRLMLNARGCQSVSDSLTLEDAILVVSYRARQGIRSAL